MQLEGGGCKTGAPARLTIRADIGRGETRSMLMRRVSAIDCFGVRMVVRSISAILSTMVRSE